MNKYISHFSIQLNVFKDQIFLKKLEVNMINKTYSFDGFYRKMVKIMRILFTLGFVLSLISVQTTSSAAAELNTPDMPLSAKDGSSIFASNKNIANDSEKLTSSVSRIAHLKSNLIMAKGDDRRLNGANMPYGSGNNQYQGFLNGLKRFNTDDNSKVTHLLTVNKSGEGIVTSTPAGIQCGETCSANFGQDTIVTLTAFPKSGWEFYGWIGACIGETCQVEMDEPKSVIAVFIFDQAPLVVEKEGQGTVTSDPEGIDCGETCSASFDIDTRVTLTPTAAPGWKFSTWSGDCTGMTCEVTMDQRRKVLATFVLDLGPFQFEDVPDGYWAEDEIYRLYTAGITTGCSQDPLLYCPEQEANRAEMAVFLERGLNVPGYQPPQGTGKLFADVPSTYWAVNWIEQLFSDGITTGCDVDPLRYCPNLSVTRAEMAV